MKRLSIPISTLLILSGYFIFDKSIDIFILYGIPILFLILGKLYHQSQVKKGNIIKIGVRKNNRKGIFIGLVSGFIIVILGSISKDAEDIFIAPEVIYYFGILILYASLNTIKHRIEFKKKYVTFYCIRFYPHIRYSVFDEIIIEDTAIELRYNDEAIKSHINESDKDKLVSFLKERDIKEIKIY